MGSIDWKWLIIGMVLGYLILGRVVAMLKAKVS